ncbi:hypothetical protein [Virgibacillus doumboii]|uniref:hypothetical protein n=1 Tax=Virgibacillus doumboii TaxID=2697503 RepID=UPI0013E0DA64|nr:hypothetical protein [Virgibacillus doumboii]
MDYTVFLDDELTIIVDDVHNIENNDDELMFINSENKLVAVVSKNEYKAIVANKPQS